MQFNLTIKLKLLQFGVYESEFYKLNR